MSGSGKVNGKKPHQYFDPRRARYHIEALRGRCADGPLSPQNLLEALKELGLGPEHLARLVPEPPPAQPSPVNPPPEPVTASHPPRKVNGAPPEKAKKKERGPLITVRRLPMGSAYKGDEDPSAG